MTLAMLAILALSVGWAVLAFAVIWASRGWSRHLHQTIDQDWMASQLTTVHRIRCAEAWFTVWFFAVSAVLAVHSDTLVVYGVWQLWLALLGLLGLIDARTGLLPNPLTLLLMLSGLGWQAWHGDHGLPPVSFLWAMVLGWAVPFTVNALHERWRGTLAIGQGDAKLLAGLGVWLGLEGLPMVWVGASGAVLVYTAMHWAVTWLRFTPVMRQTGITTAVRVTRVTFGPFLVLGASAVMISNYV
jgi:prepilin signal peptidase PulO-like enzyme (type II secretory pathway)